METLLRFLRNLFAAPFALRRWFPPEALARIGAAVTESERAHAGEVRVAIEARMNPLDVLAGTGVRERAEQVFAELRVWDTEANSGVLVYVLLAEHRVEIVADRGISARVDAREWPAVCDLVTHGFASHAPAEGILAAIARVHELMFAHFPARADNPRELADHPSVL